MAKIFTRDKLRYALGLGIPLTALLYFSLRPQGYHSQVSGGLDVNGRFCEYHIADDQIKRILLFDGDWRETLGDAALVSGGDEFSFEKKGERKFSMEYGNRKEVVVNGRTHRVTDGIPKEIIIDGRVYRVADGVVFLLHRSADGFTCQQLPVSFEEIRLKPVEADDYVRDALKRARGDNPELAAFLEAKR